MPAARFWRAVGIESWGGADIELSAFHLYEGSGASDEHFGQVVALLHGDGANGSIDILDSGPVPKTFTAVGGAAISTAASMFGGSSIGFDGTVGSRVQASETSTDFAFGTGDFTVEFWARKTADTSGGYDVALDTSRSGWGTGGWFVELSSLRGFLMYSPSSFLVSFPTNPNDGQWHHWAISRSGTTARGFKDGALVSVTTNATDIPAGQPLWVGNQTTGSSAFAGRIDDLRITKGVARYTDSFAPPAAPHPDQDAASGDQRVDDAAVLTSSIAPVSGTLASLQDDDVGTVARFNPRPAGFSLLWDFGAGGEADIRIARLGASSSQPLFLARYALQYSIDGLTWFTRGLQGNFAYPGDHAMTDVSAPIYVLQEPRILLGAGAIAASAAVSAHSTRQSLGVQCARDVEFGGSGTVYGTTKTKGTPNLPTKARVVLQHQRSKLPVRETWSNPVTGAFVFAGIDTSQQYLALAEDAEGHFRPVAANRLTPEVL